MIFKTEKLQDKIDRLGKWHRWFAWRPISFNGATVWLSFVERRVDCWQMLGPHWLPEYRIIKDGKLHDNTKD